MTDFRNLGIGAALGLVAVLLFTSGANALYKKTWAEECSQQPEGKRERCCLSKQIDCYADCDETFPPDEPYGPGPEARKCMELCKSAGARCKKEVQSSVGPNRSTSTQPPVAQKSIGDRRICCRTGIRHGWARTGDCRVRKGHVVNDKYCRPSIGRIGAREARICCKMGRTYRWASRKKCRRERGNAVRRFHCTKARR